MDESRRIAYLEKIGIPIWHAIRPLEGALETPLYNLAPASDFASVEAEALKPGSVSKQTDLPKNTAPPGIVEQASKVIKIGDESLSSESGGKAAIKNNGPGSATSTSNSIDLSQLRFAFAKIPLANGILLLAELGDENAPGFSAAETRLLTAIIVSLHSRPMSQEGLDSQLVRWPQLKGKGVQSHVQAAGDFLSAYLEAQQQRSNFDALLLLGDNLKKVLPGTQGDDGFKGPKVIAGCSLITMLQQTNEKSVLWRDIKFLKKLDLRG